MDHAPEPAGPPQISASHVPVLPVEVLELLDPQPGMTCLDCTVGRAGHAQLLCDRLGDTGRYVGLDVDPQNIAFARTTLAHAPCNVQLVHANFAQARQVLDELNIEAADILLADLGFASNQLTDPARGLSFQLEGPLDMRLDPDLPRSAAHIVNELDEKSLANLIYQYGEERLSRKIARKIVELRQRQPIKDTQTLANLVRRCYGPKRQRIDPATRTFMALRIAVNAELEALERLLATLPRIVKPGGAAAIISFHSLEDRLVKQAFVRFRHEGVATILTKKPVRADEAESRVNPPSRSARLRATRFA